MTVLIIHTDCKDDCTIQKGIKAITDNDTFYELYIHDNWQIRVPKKTNRIQIVEW